MRIELNPRYFSVQSSLLAPRSSNGFTLIELTVAIIIISVLMGLLLNRVSYYREQAEKAAMEQVVGAIQSALTLQYSQVMTRGKPSDLTALAQDNPINWLQKKPHNYAGEFYDPAPRVVESGNWLFDLKSRDLIYVVRKSDYFKPSSGETYPGDNPSWIRFHVAVSYQPSRLPSLQTAPPELTGLLFEPVAPYIWF